MVYAYRIYEYGGPDALSWEEVGVTSPGQGEVHIKHHGVGLNYIDIYTRTGLYPQESLSFVNGMEGAGEIVAVGAQVTDFKVGDRVYLTISMEL